MHCYSPSPRTRPRHAPNGHAVQGVLERTADGRGGWPALRVVIQQQKHDQVQGQPTHSGHLMTIAGMVVDEQWYQPLPEDLRPPADEAQTEATLPMPASAPCRTCSRSRLGSTKGGYPGIDTRAARGPSRGPSPRPVGVRSTRLEKRS
ncbi:hypothetical protein [Salinicola sp. CR50]|uniref:hypothetical protein n=1 Tax=Salinicola lusitanus TaxID=1949085 RepID=UPI000DA21C33